MTRRRSRSLCKKQLELKGNLARLQHSQHIEICIKVAFLCTDNSTAEKERVRPRANLTMDMKNLHEENDKILNKEIEDFKTWEVCHVCGLVESTSQTPMLPKGMYTFNVIPIKMPVTLFSGKDANIHMETQKTLNSYSNPTQLKQSRSYHNTGLPDILRISCNQNGHEDQGSRIDPRNELTPA